MAWLAARHCLPALLTGAVCAFVLEGCGGSGTATTTTTTTTSTTTTSTTTSTLKPRSASEVVKVPGWPDLAGKFPLSFAVKAGGMVYVSGLQGLDMRSMKLVEGGVENETHQTLLNLGEALKAANSSLDSVARCSVSLVNLERDFKAMNGAYAAFWPKDPPARVAVQVPMLAGNASVEIQCDAALTGHDRTVVKVPGLPDLSAKGIPLSFATKVDGMVFLSGSQGMNLTSGKLVPGGVVAETAQTLANLKRVLEAAGSSPERVVGCSVSLRNLSDFDAMNKAYKAFWPEHGALGGLPTRVCVQVGAMAGTGKVEIECTAAGSDVPAERAPKVVKVPGWPDMPLPFSAGVTAGGIAYISGNQGVDMNTSKLVKGGVGPETTQTLRNIRATAKAAGTSLEDIVACEVSLVDMNDFAEMNKAYAAFWPKDPPSRVAVQVAGLARGARVEVRCAAALPVEDPVAGERTTAAGRAVPVPVVV